ncbi:MAG TPA: NERD domain-containing protein [Kiritimatiellae bacterium]|nr:NERD domain-containing protein [Kiritimatiellia bacterium]
MTAAKSASREGAGRARVYGIPGVTARMAGMARAMWPLGLLLLSVGYLLGNRLAIPGVPRHIWSLLLLLTIPLAAALLIGVERQIQSFVAGARGEETVAASLASLPAEYTVFNAVSIPGIRRRAGDIDHIVVGPEGVFVIETMNWQGEVELENGAVRVNGQRPPFDPVARVKTLVSRVQAVLAETSSTTVIYPVLCFATNVFREGMTGTQGVIICNLDRLGQIFDRVAEIPLSREARQRLVARLADLVGG